MHERWLGQRRVARFLQSAHSRQAATLRRLSGTTAHEFSRSESFMKSTLVRILACAGLAVLAASVVEAQATQGSILGAVADSTGGAVVGASVTVTNQDTNISRSADTNTAGDYRIAGLGPGRYAVKITAQGFQTVSLDNITLVANQARRIDAELQVGDITTSISVFGGAVSQVETETATLSNIKSGREFQELPMSVLGRSFFNVTNVTAGVQGNLINGARDTANNFTIDGVTANDPLASSQTANGMIAGPEELQEIKLQTANNSAEFAQVAQFIGVSKSGSNTLHGDIYWGNYNTATAARSFYAASKPSVALDNMFAITNGGPIYIPGIYDGRNRTFYYFGYGGSRYRTGAEQSIQVPTPAMRQGDFSALLPSIAIVDPFSGQPFPGNKIPASRISSVSDAVQKMIYPDPNRPGVGTFGLGANYYVNPGGAFNSDSYTIRVDHKLGNNDNLFVRVGLAINNKDTYAGALKDGWGGYYGNHPSRIIALSDTHTFTPTIVNELKMSFSRDFAHYNDFGYGVSVVPAIGLQGIGNPSNDPILAGMPSFTFGGNEGFQGTDNWANGQNSGSNTWQWTDNLSWFRGRHNLKFGVDYRRFQANDQNQPQSIRGSFSFDDKLSGFNYANFLLGLPSYAQRAIARPNAYLRSGIFGLYAQDEFKLNGRMTLSYGLRYEYQTPWVDKYDRLFTFVPSLASVVTAGNEIPKDLVPAVIANLPLKSAQQAGLPIRSLLQSSSLNFSPRIGLAIRPLGNANTVVRLGYGLYTQMIPGYTALGLAGGPWESMETFFIQNNQPTIQFPSPFATTGEFSGLQGFSALNPYFPNERTQQWNVSVGRQIWGTAIDVAYVGTKTANLPYTDSLNELRPSTTPYDWNRVAFPQYGYVNLTQTGASSIYHGLNLQADRKMRGGLSFNANYTWSKALSDLFLYSGNRGTSVQQNQYQRYLERGDDPDIRRQQLRFSYIWELPIGRDKYLLRDMPRILNSVVGGWQLSGITTMLTGQRLSPSFSGTDPANTDEWSGMRPDRIGDGNFDSSLMRDNIRNRQPILDKSAFAVPATGRGSYGNSARQILTGPGQAVWNIVAAKGFMLTEQARLQFRGEFFNAFNRANFSNPNTNISSSRFGLVTGSAGGRKILFGIRIDY
jgi:hypothetical protein